MRKSFAVSLPVLLLGLVSPSWGQDAVGKGSADNPALISWEATLASGKVAKLVSRDGDLSRLTQDQGKKLAITTSLENKPDNVVTFRIFEIREVENAGEAFRQIEKVSLQPGASYSTSLRPAVTLRLNAIRPAASGPADRQVANPTSSGPITDTLISWEMTTPSQKQAHVVSRAGELTRVAGEGYSVGILPTLKSEGSVDFRIFKITQVQGAGEILKQTDRFTLTTGGQQLAYRSPDILLRLTGVKPKT